MSKLVLEKTVQHFVQSFLVIVWLMPKVSSHLLNCNYTQSVQLHSMYKYTFTVMASWFAVC